MDIPSKCVTCINPYFLYQNLCVLNCPTAFYPSNNTCLSCPVECSSCTSASTCSTCSNSFIYYQLYCLSSCPPSTFIANSSVTLPTSNISIIRQQCQPCALTSCFSCPLAADICVVCHNNWYIN